MPTAGQVDGIMSEIEHRLQTAASRGVALHVADKKLEDDWLYVVVVPTHPGVRALDHADEMARIERELRAEGKEHILLVPTLDD